jgi:tetratricopeptide (TPR) repeat protein
VITSAILLMSSNVLLSGRMSNVIDTSNVRGELWAAAIQQFHLAPALGTGSGTYLYYGRQFRSEAVQGDPVHAHSDYLELLCEYGVIGATFAGIFLIVHLHSGFRVLTRIARKRLRPAKRLFSTEVALIAGALAAVVALMAHSVVDFNAHIPSNTLFFAFIFGLLASPSSDPQMTGTHATGSLRSVRVVLSVAGALMLIFTAPLLLGEFDAEWARVQLRCKEYVDATADLSQRVSRVLPTIASGTVFPTDSFDRRWPMMIARDHLVPRAITFAERGTKREARNPDLFYYLGEAHHFAALFSAEPAQRAEQFDAAARSYERAHQLFPADIRILLNLARAYDNTGTPTQAEAVLAKAFAADSKLGNVYAHYGFHLWKQKKLTRAEAYYRRALSMDGENKIARAGMGDIERVRRLSNDPQHVELYGDPLESFDLDPPNEDDERRGVRLDE